MRDDRRSVGASGEKMAREYLQKKGYRIRELNFRCSLGEIDIIAEEKGELVFVEVRTKRGNSFGTPEESITRRKKSRLVDLSNLYLQTLPRLPENWRVDVIAIEVDERLKVTRLEHIKNALV